ncbi:MAG TPA: amidohydrolase family protein [Chloroflexota bacterium]
MTYSGPVIDADVHHNWKSARDIVERLPRRWRDYAMGPGKNGALPISPTPRGIQHPGGTNKRLDTFPACGGPPASDYETLRAQLLEAHNVERCVLVFENELMPAIDNPYFAHALIEAAHDWNRDTWLSENDDRLYSVVMVPTQLPEKAAGEIRRVGRNPKIVAALLSFNGLHRPYGDPMYRPIFEAAQELDLPVVMHATGAEGYGGVLPSNAGGRAVTRLEGHTLLHMSTIQHVTSLVLGGVFEQFPRLKFVAIEAGTAWLPWLAWKLDAHYDILRRESEWVKRPPSEYLREHVLLTTQPLEMSPEPEQLQQLYEAFGGMDDLLCFATDYPHWDADTSGFIRRRLPPDWHRKVFYENALGAFRWSRKAALTTG